MGEKDDFTVRIMIVCLRTGLSSFGEENRFSSKVHTIFFVLGGVKLIFLKPEFSGSKIQFLKKYKKLLKTIENLNNSRN